MLSRFADARLRADLDKTRDARDQARDTARRLFARLEAARQDIRDRYEQIARLEQHVAGLEKQCNEQMHQLAAEQARTQETAGRCGDVAPSLSLLASRTRPTCRLTAGHAGWHRGDDDSEWTMTQETQP